MKKLLIISIVFIHFQCNDCLHCNEGTGSIIRYSVINSLNENISVEVYGENINTILTINSKDTSRSWDIITLPLELESEFYTLDLFNQGNSFPYNSDSILVKVDENVLRTYYRNVDYSNSDWDTSIYIETSYVVVPPEELPPNEGTSSIDNVFEYYYLLDSMNLKLN